MTDTPPETALSIRALDGRIMAPGDHYRGKFAAWETPAHAVHDGCPLDDCRQALVDHIRKDHGQPDPEDAIMRARARLAMQMDSERRRWSW